MEEGRQSICTRILEDQDVSDHGSSDALPAIGSPVPVPDMHAALRTIHNPLNRTSGGDSADRANIFEMSASSSSSMEMSQMTPRHKKWDEFFRKGVAIRNIMDLGNHGPTNYPIHGLDDLESPRGSDRSKSSSLDMSSPDNSQSSSWRNERSAITDLATPHTPTSISRKWDDASRITEVVDMLSPNNSRNSSSRNERSVITDLDTPHKPASASRKSDDGSRSAEVTSPQSSAKSDIGKSFVFDLISKDENLSFSALDTLPPPPVWFCSVSFLVYLIQRRLDKDPKNVRFERFMEIVFRSAAQVMNPTDMEAEENERCQNKGRGYTAADMFALCEIYLHKSNNPFEYYQLLKMMCPFPPLLERLIPVDRGSGISPYN